MNITGKWLATGAVVALVAVLIGSMHYLSDKEEAGRGEKIALAQLPPAVKATFEKESQGGTLQETEKITDGGKTVYGAEILANGEEKEVIVAEDGRVLERGRKEDDD